MILTHRAIMLFLLAGLLMLLFSSIISPYLGCALFNGFWLFFVIWDFYLTPGRSFLHVRRDMPEKLSNGTDNTISITVRNGSHYALSAALRDDNPFSRERKTLKIALPPGEESQVSYSVRPHKRGDYHFGCVYLRVKGVLGLVTKQFRYELEITARVFPNIAQVSNYDLFVLKGRLLELGLKPSRIYGMGTEFESLREYHPDDDYRKINWKATARRNRIIVENFETERSQSLMIVIDTGRMMISPVGEMAKLEYALNAALLLSYVALKGDDRVGIMTFSSDINDFVPPGKGRRQLHLILDTLQKIEATVEEPDLGSVIRLMSLKKRSRSLVVIFTDLVDTEISRETISFLRSLSPLHLPLCVLVSDPQITSLADRAPENSRILYQKAFAGDLLWQRHCAIQELRRRGVLVLDVSPDKLSSAIVNKYLEVKMRGRL